MGLKRDLQLVQDVLEEPLRRGTRVRLKKSFKEMMLKRDPDTGCPFHIEEFGNLTGTVLGPTYPNGEGPEIDVLWPKNVRYVYDPEDLEIVWD
jgi:hypothetical protein